MKPALTVAALPNDPVSLAERREARNRPPDFSAVELVMRYKTHNPQKPAFNRDLSALADAYPHHRFLIQQLLVGVSLHFALKPRSFQSYQSSHLGIENFIAFLNSDEPLQSVPTSVADLSYAIGRLFHAWLIRRHSGRASNRKLYGNLRSAILALQKKHGGSRVVGPVIEWPPGPRTTEQVSESYSGATLNALVGACLEDIKYVIDKMSSFRAQLGRTAPFSDNDGILVNVRSNRYRTKSSLTSVESEWRAMATAYNIHPAWPLGMPLEEATMTFSMEEQRARYQGMLSAQGRARRVIQAMSFGPQGKEMSHGQNAYFSHFAFSAASLYPFILFVQINTGWNLESVLSLSLPIESHIESDLVDEHYCIIYSSKQRTEKAVSHRSNRKSPYGVYRLLKFVEKMVTRQSSSPHFLPGQLWQFLPIKNLWMKTETMLTTIVGGAAISQYSAKFLARHDLPIDTEAKSPTLESRRLRTTVQTKRRQQGLTIDQMQGLQGHADIDTTSVHYDDDVGAAELKNQQIRKLQTRHVADFHSYHARLAQSATLQELREALRGTSHVRQQHLRLGRADDPLELTQEQVTHLMSPFGQTYIAACTNALAPTWPDAEKFVGAGERCRFFNRCSMCDRALIFKEALPWVARRICDLDDLRLIIPAPEWANNYEDERAGWQWVLDNWSDRAEVAEGVALARTDAYILPRIMRGAA
ncbi:MULTISPECIES: hypothetical protein [Burkholderia]|uniref:hypothetical protein n=1 Tax=Burkholderia TaxID=32008 RepID=UPI000F545828|nr:MULTISPECIES: hypothetical protein [Burkholderia]RQM59711.1 hypothetical protein EHZ18_09265 [Burkholderia vietnamiensis]